MSLSGLLNINKPSGVTSRRVVDQVQRLVRPAKVGHAGTLDPLACGVLVVGVGQATRLVEYVQRMLKHYHGTFLLGRTSTTEDVEGEVTLLADAPMPTLEQLHGAAAELTGAIEQRPPAFSALKVAGQRSYTLARAGQAVDLTPRQIEIRRLTIERYEYPELDLDIECGSGTYVRSLGRDLAERVRTGAVMSALTRLSVGHFTLAAAIGAESLNRNNIAEQLLPPLEAVKGVFECHSVSADEARKLGHGLSIAVEGATSDGCAAVDDQGRLVAILTRRSGPQFSPAKFFPAE